MSAKTTFLLDKELSAWWNGIVKSGDFQRVQVFIMAAFMESNPTKEMTIGAQSIMSNMRALSENEEGSSPIPDPGIVHHRATVPEPKED